jgi:hypothetical protein
MLMAAACATQVAQRSIDVNPGDTREQVRATMGDPGNRQFQGALEAWQYCGTGFVNDSFVVVWFRDGTVTGLTTYENSAGDIGFCDRHFVPIRWEDAPDVTVEVRQR